LEIESKSGGVQITDQDVDINFEFMKSKIESPGRNQKGTIGISS
jgi:hypothetical protein